MIHTTNSSSFRVAHRRLPVQYLIVMVLLVGVVANEAIAQTQNRGQRDTTTLFGVVFLVHNNSHCSSFSRLPGVPSCCREYSNGSGYGFGVGVVYSAPLLDRVRLEGRMILSDLSASLASDEYMTGSWNGNTVPVTIEHTVEASLQTIGIEPQLHYRLFNFVGISAGVNLSYLLKGKFSQKEFIKEPSSLLFETGSRYRNTYSGNLERSNRFQAAAVAGIEMNFPLNPAGSFTIHPEISYTYGLTDILSTNRWKTHSIRIGLSLRKAI